MIKAFELLGLNWEEYIEQNEIFNRPLDVNRLKGDYSKAQKAINWNPKTTFNELVEIMVKEDCESLERWQKGEHFPWDASNYPSEKRILSRKISLD